MYSEFREKPLEQAREGLIRSGIIALRRHCMGLNMEAQMRALTNYITADIPSLIYDVSNWVAASAGGSTLGQKRKVREALDLVERSIRLVCRNLL